jgi:hypothetical protein
MGVEIDELVSSPSLSLTSQGGTLTSKYVITDCGSMQAAHLKAEIYSPVLLAVGAQTLVRAKIQIDTISDLVYLATVDYEDEGRSENTQQPPQPGTWQFSFKTTGGKHKVTQSKKTVDKQWCYSMSNQPPDLKGVIGWDGKKVNGVEVHVPVLEFTITAHYDPRRITTTFMQNLARFTPRVNSQPWMNFDRGEVLFMGGEGQGDIPTVHGQRVKPIPVQLFFAASENATIETGSNPAGIKKAGWDYIWFRYQKVEGAQQDMPVAVHAYVEQLYTYAPFMPFFGFG